MNEKNRRPLFVSLSIAYLGISALIFLAFYYQLAEFLLRSGWRGLMSFAIGLGLIVLMLVTFIQIRNRSRMGRILAIVTFGLLTLNSLLAVSDFAGMHGRHSSGILLGWAVISFRLVSSVVLLAAFIFSDNVKNYFTVEASDLFTNPPPPPSFDD